MDQPHGHSLNGPAASLATVRRLLGRHVSWEAALIIAAFATHLTFQLHATVYHGNWGQDWVTHKLWTADAAAHPWRFWTHYTQGRTNPPLYHLLTGAVKRAAGTPHYVTALGVMNVTLGIIGALCFYAVVRRLVQAPLVRVAAVVFVLFLPFAMIHAQVHAADALATPLFWLMLWLLVRLQPDASWAAFVASLAVVMLLEMASSVVKFTFGSFIAAAAVWSFLQWWTRQWPAHRLAVAVLLIAVVPAVFARAEMRRYQAEQANSLGIDFLPVGRLSEAAMNPRSILFLRPADYDILSAPAYEWTVNGQYELLVNNKHSFPALLHLAMFTDILNIYQFDPYDYYFGQRTAENHRRMRIAVRTAIVATLVTAAGVLVMAARSAFTVLVRRDGRDLGVLSVLLFSSAWFVNIVGLLPFVKWAYLGGYWLPRLLAPALLGFFAVAFVFLDRCRLSRRWQIAVLAAVLAQSSLHASFLWPHPSPGPLYEPNGDAAAVSSGVYLRVMNWQDWPGVCQQHACWFQRRLGIVINRPVDGRSETWNLKFALMSGASGIPTPYRVRVSSPRSAPRDVDVYERTTVSLDVALAPGRNDVVVDVVSPLEIVEGDDPLVRMVRISDVQLHPIE